VFYCIILEGVYQHCRWSFQVGAGTGVPGLITARCGAHVTLSDHHDNHHILESLQRSCDENGLHDVKVIPLTWGCFTPSLISLPPQDIVLASDCLYDTKGCACHCVSVCFVHLFVHAFQYLVCLSHYVHCSKLPVVFCFLNNQILRSRRNFKFQFITSWSWYMYRVEFEDVIVTFAYLMEKNPLCEAWTTYQERRWASYYTVYHRELHTILNAIRKK